MRTVANAEQGARYWLPDKPERDAEYGPWYTAIARGVAASDQWRGNNAHGTIPRNLNPWHPTFNDKMFYI